MSRFVQSRFCSPAIRNTRRALRLGTTLSTALLFSGSVFLSCSLVNVDCASADPACQPVLALLRPGAGLIPVSNASYSRFLFTVTSGDNFIRGFSIDYGTGTLTPVSSLGVGAFSSISMVRHPTRPILLVPQNNPNDGVRSFLYDATTAAISFVNNQTTGNLNSHRVAVFPSGSNILFNSVQGGATYFYYAALDSLGNIGPPSLKDSSLPSNCQTMALHPSGSYFFADGCGGGGGIQRFSIDGAGTAANLGSTTFNGTDQINGFPVFDPAGHMFILSQANRRLVSFDVNTGTGALTAVTNIDTGISSATTLVVHPSGTRLYAAYASGGEIQEYAIGSDGSLTLTRQATVLPAGQQYERSCIDAAGKFIFVARFSASAAIQTVLINDDGSLSPGPNLSSGNTITTCVTTSDVR